MNLTRCCLCISGASSVLATLFEPKSQISNKRTDQQRILLLSMLPPTVVGALAVNLHCAQPHVDATWIYRIFRRRLDSRFREESTSTSSGNNDYHTVRQATVNYVYGLTQV